MPDNHLGRPARAGAIDPIGAIAGAFVRHRAVRRLDRAEADTLGFAGPLVLFEIGPRFRLPVIGRLQGRPVYEIVRHPTEVVLRVTADELARLDITP